MDSAAPGELRGAEPEMASRHSITCRPADLRAGVPMAVEPLWLRFYADLVRHARQTLGATPQRADDEQDVATSAFESFCEAVERGRFPNLKDRDGL